MNELLEKYANVLLKCCLKMYEGQPLLISASTEAREFVRIVAKEAYKLGVKDIYFDMVDPYLKHDALKELELDELKKLSFWDRDKWNIYAKKDAAFLMLVSENPTLMLDIDPKKMNDITMYSYETRKDFEGLRKQSKLAWCIAAVPVLDWAREVFPMSEKPVDDLWNAIFDICHIKDENPEAYWNNHIKELKKCSDILNQYKFKSLKYSNSKGTNFTIDLPKGHIWSSGSELLRDGREILANFPTEEVFTSPDKYSANGVLYSSKPLSYNNKIVDDFYIKFKNGQVVDYKAKVGEDTLKELISSVPNIDYLGEVALVESDSAISKKNIVFYETLFDENAACHVALGASFPSAIENGTTMNDKTLEKNGLNMCLNHVDFMVGTDDLHILGVLKDGSTIPIFENGNFTLHFKER